MKKNYLLSGLLSLISLGVWASGGTDFGSAVVVQADSPTDITYDVVGDDGTYVEHWFKYTATHDDEYVFIEDQVKLIIQSEGTLKAAWPGSYGDGVVIGSSYDDATYFGTTMHFKMKKGETCTFNLYSSTNADTNETTAKPVSSSFKVIVYDAAKYPGGESKDSPILLPKSTDRLVFPGSNWQNVWVKVNPDATGRLSFKCPFGGIYEILVEDENGVESSYLEDKENSSKEYSIFRFMVEQGKAYYVNFSVEKRMNVSWSLEAVEPGGDCMLPKEITAGTNNIIPGVIYYKYAVSKDCYIELNSSSKNSNAAVFTTCNSEDEQNSVPTKDGFYLKRKVAKDEVVLIAIQGQENSTFTLKELDAKAGWDAKNAIDIPALQQDVTFTINPHADTYWFKFVAPVSAVNKEYMVKSTTENRPEILVAVSDGDEIRLTPVIAIDSLNLRLDAGETYYVTWAVDEYAFGQYGDLNYDNPGDFKFQITEVDVIDGMYCDRPLTFEFKDGKSKFVLGNENGIPEYGYSKGSDIGRIYYYEFTAPDNGFVSFVTMNKEWSHLWSISYKESCDGIEYALAPTLPSESIAYGAKYTIPVIKGRTYIWTPFVFKTETKVTVDATWKAPEMGEACSNPIPMSIAEEMPMANTTKNVGTWFGIDADKAGEYIITGKPGTSGWIEYKVGDCDSKLVRATKDYATGISTAKVFVKEATQIMMYYFYNSYEEEGEAGFIKVDYNNDVTEGTHPGKPIKVAANTEYTIPIWEDGTSVWYSYNATGSSIEAKVTTSAGYMNTVKVYLDSDSDNPVSDYQNSTISDAADNGDGTFTFIHTFNAAEAGKTYLLNFGYVQKDTKFTVVDTGGSGLEVNDKAADVNIYPNPNDGEFNIALGYMTAGGDATIQLSDMSGAIVYKKVVSGENASVNVRGVASGVYLLKITNDETSIVKKVIIR